MEKKLKSIGRKMPYGWDKEGKKTCIPTHCVLAAC